MRKARRGKYLIVGGRGLEFDKNVLLIWVSWVIRASLCFRGGVNMGGCEAQNLCPGAP